MKSTELRKITISRIDIDALFDIIQYILNESMDSQIFITQSIYNEMIKNNTENMIWVENVLDSFQYGNNVEKAFIFRKDNKSWDITYQMNFVSNCNNYKQLTFFYTKGTTYYHYLRGMKYIYIVNAD